MEHHLFYHLGQCPMVFCSPQSGDYLRKVFLMMASGVGYLKLNTQHSTFLLVLFFFIREIFLLYILHVIANRFFNIIVKV